MAEPVTKTLRRVSPLDSIRFVAALIVLLAHFNVAPAIKGVWPVNWFGWAVRGVVDNAFNGPAAVIVFFVISGFCIHYPHVDRSKFDVAEFYASRYIRIIPPMLVAVLIWVMMGSEFESLTIGILWSLYAELIYYTAYPLLMRLARRWGWSVLLGAAAVGWAAVVISEPLTPEYPDHGIVMTTIMGLPCWLLGCILADRVRGTAPGSKPSSIRSIWAWRLFIWLSSLIASVLEFHSMIGAPITLNIFAVAVFFWLEHEISWARAHGAVSILEGAGQWSYSIYLMHLPLAAAAIKLCATLGVAITPANPLVIVAVVCGCYIFNRLVEKPSHRLAKMAARLIGSRRYALRPL